ncbi:hypothetical protein ABT136_33020 [Streptomyces sp. NPDC001856]|uniref:hypothetical protein n=1 Tax=Streptomyces sp. NPDC001856 TaxID=3154399 RepID=UPI0033251223
MQTAPDEPLPSDELHSPEGEFSDGTPAAPAALRDLLAFEDGNALRLLCAPAGDAVVHRIAVGMDDLAAGRPGTLLLAVGAAPDATTVREAALRGACAVVLGEPPSAAPVAAGGAGRSAGGRRRPPSAPGPRRRPSG